MLVLASRPPDTVAPPDDGEVHLWVVDLTRSHGERADRAVLSADERARADRYHARRRAHFIAGRAALRRLLGGYLRRRPEGIAIRYDAIGKPVLDSTEPLAFNLSHSGDLAVCAITAGGAVGTDVEAVRTVLRPEALARRFFTPSESRAIDEAAVDDRTLAFLRAWTRKEACLKASGDGLHLPLSTFEVPVDDREWCEVRDRDGRVAYQVWAYAAGPAHVGATALPPGDWRTQGFSLP